MQTIRISSLSYKVEQLEWRNYFQVWFQHLKDRWWRLKPKGCVPNTTEHVNPAWLSWTSLHVILDLEERQGSLESTCGTCMCATDSRSELSRSWRMQLLAPTLFHCMHVLAGLHFFPDSRRQGYMGKALAQSLTLHAFTLHTFRLAYKDRQTDTHTHKHTCAHTQTCTCSYPVWWQRVVISRGQFKPMLSKYIGS